MNQPRINIRWYVLGDFIAGLLAWVVFYFIRKEIIAEAWIVGHKFYKGLLIFPLAWTTLFLLTGSYNNIYHKSRLSELANTLMVTFSGSVIILFLFIIYDVTGDYSIYYKEFLSLIALQTFFTYAIRLILLSKARNQLNRGSVYFNTLIVGSSTNAAKLHESIIHNQEGTGYRIIGFVNANGSSGSSLPPQVTHFGNTGDLEAVIAKNNIEEVIIAVEKKERTQLEKVLQLLSTKDINIKITPDTVDIISGAVQTNNVLGVPLIDLHSVSKVLYRALGPKLDKAFQDGTHHNNYGSYELARCVVEGIRKNVPALARFLAVDAFTFDPTRPDDPDTFMIPASAAVDAKKPDGN